VTPNSRSYITQFSQPDSIIPNLYNPQDWNRYAYARYNPLKYTDPSGHDPWWCDGKTASCDEKYLPDITGTRGGHFRSFDGGWNEYRYSTWNLLRNGAPCSACHVTHWTGTIPTNDEISLTQVQGWRSLDQYTLFVHYAGLESTAFYVSQAISAADPSSYIRKGSQQEVSDAFGSWQVERTSEPRSIYRYTSAGAEKPGFYATTDPTMSSTEARSLWLYQTRILLPV
jgi:hypothetical protein